MVRFGVASIRIKSLVIAHHSLDNIKAEMTSNANEIDTKAFLYQEREKIKLIRPNINIKIQ